MLVAKPFITWEFWQALVGVELFGVRVLFDCAVLIGAGGRKRRNGLS